MELFLKLVKKSIQTDDTLIKSAISKISKNKLRELTLSKVCLNEYVDLLGATMFEWSHSSGQYIDIGLPNV